MRYLNVCPDFFDHVGKRLNKKAKVSFKINNIRDWITSNYNTHIGQYLTKYSQPDNEIWSVNRI